MIFVLVLGLKGVEVGSPKHKFMCATKDNLVVIIVCVVVKLLKYGNHYVGFNLVCFYGKNNRISEEKNNHWPVAI